MPYKVLVVFINALESRGMVEMGYIAKFMQDIILTERKMRNDLHYGVPLVSCFTRLME